MLTDREKRWLQLRKLYEGVNYYSYYSCMHCSEYNIGRWPWYNYPCNRACLYNGCPNIDIGSSAALSDYVEAAKFEARVAVKLAEFYHHTTLYLDDSDGQKLRCWETCPARFYCGDSYTHLTCGEAILKTAQLAVEEEMYAENG